MKLKTLCSAVALAVGMAGAAHAYPQFSVNETPYGGSSQTGDEFGFNYNTTLTLNTGGTFSEVGGVTFTSLAHETASGQQPNTGSVIGRSIGSPVSTGYFLFGNIVSSTGTYVPVSGGFSGTFKSLTLDLYIQSATLGKPGVTANDQYLTTNATLLATAALDGNVTSDAQYLSCAQNSNQCGAWAVNTTFNKPLSTAFLAFFTNPTNFYLDLHSGGQNNGPITAPTSLPATVTDTGHGTAYFAVPEPASLTLLGGGLLLGGLAARRKKKRTQAA
ncbi:MAG TPA: flocculation-associated PEP-CTERM protein PepA [Stellaceae bacterium]|nr:flocculation-associated PEP-CTERM protein PepA [Stellaceae bacterium]